MKRLRVYADTSVYGGCFDPEFEDDSRQFFREVAEGRYVLLFSPTHRRQGTRGRAGAGAGGDQVPVEALEFRPDSEDVVALRDAYLEAGVVSPSSLADAEHIASATVADANLVVSWNFRHILQIEKARGYEAISLLRGYKPPRIASPRQVVRR